MTKILTTYPDEYIEFWAKVFLANPIVRCRGVLFAAFLVAPDEILAAVAMQGMIVPEDYRPLLPQQRKVQHRQDWTIAILPARYWQAHPYKNEKEPSCPQPQ